MSLKEYAAGVQEMVNFVQARATEVRDFLAKQK